VLFDAIEFDAKVAAGDVLYDLAFLLADLVDHKLECRANIVLNRYLSVTDKDANLEGLAALPLYLSIRAAIRAKVAIARLGARAGATSPDAAKARAYFALAVGAIDPGPPRLVAIGGLSGTGKSSLARELAPSLPPLPGAIIIRSDVERKSICGVDEYAKLPASACEPDVTAQVYAALARKAALVIAAGHSAVVDAVFADEGERKLIEDIAGSHRVAFHGIFLDADLETRIRRVGTRIADASDADAAVARKQEAYRTGKVRWARVNASRSLDQVLANAKKSLV
jgi:predicted kinase